MSLLGLLTLLRPPNVFTAFADSLAGLVMLARAWAIVVASGCLYLAGIVFNDVFDRKVDARERPTRPIPSGVVPVRIAVLPWNSFVAGVYVRDLPAGLSGAEKVELVTALAMSGFLRVAAYARSLSGRALTAPRAVRSAT